MYKKTFFAQKLLSILYVILLISNRYTYTLAFNKITLMTAPLGYNESGHAALMRSLTEGLTKTNIPFNLNPHTMHEVGDVVIVLANIQALSQAIEWKKKGKIKKLLAGPTLMVRSNEYNGIIGSPYIDAYNVNSDWTYVAYIEDLPCLKRNLHIWYSGVDTQFWNPSSTYTGKNVLVYWKTEPESFCINTEKILKKYGWNPIRIQYGHYNIAQYKQLLSQCKFAVFLSRSESQGLALAEAWSMNIPTLPWNPQQLTYQGKTFSTVSGCPYLTEKTGKDWKNFSDFESILTHISTHLNKCSPREWVLNNMSDEKSIECLLNIINQLY